MLKQIWSVAALDLLLWRRMPLAMLSALLPPITMVLLLEVLSMAVTQQPVALVVEGTGDHSQKLAKIIEDDDDAYLLSVTDKQTAERLLRNQEVAAVITIPQDFERKVSHHHWWQGPAKMAQIKLAINNVDIDFSDDIRRSVDRSVVRFGAGSAAFAVDDDDVNEKQSTQESAKSKTIAPPGASQSESEKTSPDDQATSPSGTDNPYLVDVDEHDLRETNVEWMNYQVIPALVLLVLNVGLTGTALLCAQDIERKTSKHLLLSPQSNVGLVCGRLLGGFIASMIALIPALVVCCAVRIINPPPGHWPALLAIFAATALCSAGLGAILGTTLKGTRTIAMASCVLATYLFLLGGGFTTIAFLPQWLRDLSAFVPIRYAIDGMRQALFYKTLDGVPMDLLVLCATAVATSVIGATTVRKSWAR